MNRDGLIKKVPPPLSLISVRLNPEPSGWDVLDIAYGTGSLKQEAIGKRLLISMKLFTNASRGIPLWTDISLTDNDLDAGMLISMKLTTRREEDDVAIPLFMIKRKSQTETWDAPIPCNLLV